MPDIQTPDEGTDEQDPVIPQVDQDPVAPEPTEVVTPPEDVTPEPKPELVPKEKFVASQKESILNHARVEVANTRIEELTKQDTPTDEAMRLLYPEWDNLDDYNKRVLVRQEAVAMQQANLTAQNQQILARQKLDDQLEEVVDKPEYAKLKGKESEFRRFAKKKENQGIDVGTLAKAFLFDGSDDEPPAPKPTPMQEALPAGSGGPRDPLKPKKMSLEEAAILKQTNYKEYVRLLKAGAFEDDI